MSNKKKFSTDKKGIRIINAEHDFYQLFGIEKGSDYDDFARLFEKSQKTSRHKALLEEKKKNIHHIKPLTMKEKIKSYPAPQLDLDLHGDRASEAEQRTESFIRTARENNYKTIRLIVGKGLHSQGKAVLPDIVEQKIIQLKKEKLILNYLWEKKEKLKSGAIIVYLIPIL